MDDEFHEQQVVHLNLLELVMSLTQLAHGQNLGIMDEYRASTDETL